jgi:hypothetical protein
MPTTTPIPSSGFKTITAMTAEGYELPVIDVTHPAFAVDDSPDAVKALRAAFIESMRRRYRVPKLLMRLMLKLAARRSLMLRALLEPEAAFLGGLSTYVLKLGAENLVPPFNDRVDRQVAASPAIVAIRVRLQQTARLLADGIEQDLAARPGVALHLINIGGGSAIDSLNALILLQRSDPRLLARSVTIHVLDLDARAPMFGANALAALRAGGGPLAGRDISLTYVYYGWDDTGPLVRLVSELSTGPAIVAASSEGALFEYGSDDAVIGNLRVLRAHDVRPITGSVTRADDITVGMLTTSLFKLVPRGIEAFSALVRRAGYSVARVEPALLSDQVMLRPDGDLPAA